MNSIVIARYKEDLSWVVNIPDAFEIFVYNKGENIVDPTILAKVHHIVKRPNLGRESETYLYHMQLSGRSDRDFTVFAQGDPFEHSPDFLDLLKVWERWSDLQPLTWQWRAEANIPPLPILLDYEGYLRGRLRVRAERFSLSTWGPLGFIDPGAQRTSVDYRAQHGRLPEGTNVASHFLELCGLTELAAEAAVHEIGVFCYGAVFAVRNHLVARLPSASLATMRQLSKGAPVYGYILERMWLHLFGANFDLPVIPPAPRNEGQFRESERTYRMLKEA